MCVRIDQHEAAIKTLRKQSNDPRQLKLDLKDSIYPGHPLAILRYLKQEDTKEGIACEWGLLPPWTNERDFGKKNTFNARCESLHEKVCFKKAFATQRCAIPVNGFWEHVKRNDAKGMVRFSVKDEAVFWLAGLWEWHPEFKVLSTTVITMPALKPVQNWHHRMPLTLNENALDKWLNPTWKFDIDGLLELYKKPELLSREEITINPQMNLDL